MPPLQTFPSHFPKARVDKHFPKRGWRLPSKLQKTGQLKLCDLDTASDVSSQWTWLHTLVDGGDLMLDACTSLMLQDCVFETADDIVYLLHGIPNLSSLILVAVSFRDPDVSPTPYMPRSSLKLRHLIFNFVQGLRPSLLWAILSSSPQLKTLALDNVRFSRSPEDMHGRSQSVQQDHLNSMFLVRIWMQLDSETASIILSWFYEQGLPASCNDLQHFALVIIQGPSDFEDPLLATANMHFGRFLTLNVRSQYPTCLGKLTLGQILLPRPLTEYIDVSALTSITLFSFGADDVRRCLAWMVRNLPSLLAVQTIDLYISGLVDRRSLKQCFTDSKELWHKADHVLANCSCHLAISLRSREFLRATQQKREETGRWPGQWKRYALELSRTPLHLYIRRLAGINTLLPQLKARSLLTESVLTDFHTNSWSLD